jgi:Transglutaminase-like enzymes, putative cysteine proteases
MGFEKFFKLISYLAVFGGFFSLWVSGSFGLVGTALFIGVLVAGWFLEDSRWQISERVGTILIVLSLPVFYLGFRLRLFSFADYGTLVSGVLARMILVIAAIKVLQKKSDRDWIFLYLMSFFEVLLAAALSISALYVGSFLIYLVVMTCAFIAFEIRKSSRVIAEKAQSSLRPIDSGKRFSSVRLPVAAVILVAGIGILAVPLFFMLPRVGGAGLGGGTKGISTSSGFSDSVQLGKFGRIQQNDEVVMRIRLDNRDPGQGPLYWRGVALDTFDGQTWSRSLPMSKQPFVKDERELIQVDYATGRESLTLQTIYLEPLDTPVLFALSRPVAIQGNFVSVSKDGYGDLTFPRNPERMTYKVLSDRSQPSVARLRADNQAYSEDSRRYLSLPEKFDRRIANLAESVTRQANNRYDKAKAIESYLQNNLGYTLDLKAGGPDPLSDFLFNVREGHCEYFATAMAIMLRTQGIATRIVNGFQQGEYNDTADMYIVRQRNAHSWVEVYFPGESAWVRFDPTPFAGQPASAIYGGIVSKFGGYMDALEAFWIQYFVAFDNQEQRSLFRSVRNGFVEYQANASTYISALQDRVFRWWTEVRGQNGMKNSIAAVGYGLGYLAMTVLGILLLYWIYRKIKGLDIWRNLLWWLRNKNQATIVEFYERMQRVLAGKGLRRQPHQTPLEFAHTVNMPEAIRITEKYNRVRFGEKYLSRDEADEIEFWLRELQAAD